MSLHTSPTCPGSGNQVKAFIRDTILRPCGSAGSWASRAASASGYVLEHVDFPGPCRRLETSSPSS